jgi:hypothetical protein
MILKMAIAKKDTIRPSQKLNHAKFPIVTIESILTHPKPPTCLGLDALRVAVLGLGNYIGAL